MDADGSGQTNLTNNPATNETGPSWSADGKKIAFQSSVNATTVDIYFMNADGSNVTRVPNQPAGTNNWATWMGKDKLLFAQEDPVPPGRLKRFASRRPRSPRSPPTPNGSAGCSTTVGRG